MADPEEGKRGTYILPGKYVLTLLYLLFLAMTFLSFILLFFFACQLILPGSEELFMLL